MRGCPCHTDSPMAVLVVDAHSVFFMHFRAPAIVEATPRVSMPCASVVHVPKPRTYCHIPK